jgi:hypothetical protein
MTEHAKGLLTAMDLAVGQRGVDGAAEGDGVPDLFGNDEAQLPLKSKARSGPQGGRPAGSRNRRTDEWVQHLLSRYQSPLVGLLEIYSRPVDELCTSLGLDVDAGGRLEAFKVQQAAMIAALPYIHQKQPMAVTVSAKSAGLIMIGSFDGDGSDAPEMTLEYQRVSDADPAKSDDDKSDGIANVLTSHDKLDCTQ